MRCPFCSHDQDRVVDSRVADEGRSIRRRRECEVCGRRFTTYERAEEATLMVEKRSGEKVPFDSARLLSGIVKACVNRPVDEKDLEKLAEDVLESVKAGGGGVVRSADLGKEILERLRVLDEVAYLRFASVYKDFQELTDFERELGLLQKKVPPKEKASKS